jgi:hypothetical protein
VITRAALVAVMLLGGVAHADQGWKDDRAFFEWSTWVRLGYGVARVEEPAMAIPRSETPQPVAMHDQVGVFEAALGADFLLPLPTKHTRLGPWVEARNSGEVVTGLELQLAASPRDLNMFFYDGEGVWSIRAGASSRNMTAAVAWGYRCPWVMFSDAPKTTRYMIGARIVASFTRDLDDANVWAGSLGIEFEPVGALRYLAGIQSWY